MEGRAYPLIILAVESNNTNLTQMLLDRGAAVDATTSSGGHGLTPLHIATEMRHSALMKLVIRYGADVDAKTNSGIAAVHLAADDVECMKISRCWRKSEYRI